MNNDVRTVNELKRDLIGNSNKKEYRYELNEDEEKALQRFK